MRVQITYSQSPGGVGGGVNHMVIKNKISKIIHTPPYSNTKLNVKTMLITTTSRKIESINEVTIDT